MSDPYEIACECGAVARGDRGPQHQIVGCPSCQRELFVFPRSPLPKPGHTAEAVALRRPLPGWRFWLPPVAGGLAALAVVAVLIGAVVRSRRPASDGPPPTAERVAATAGLARAHARAGALRLAAAEAAAAHVMANRIPTLLPAGEVKRVRRLARESALLADLSAESLAEILRHSVGLPDAEWRAVFAERYAGRGIAFDARVSRGGDDRLTLDYHVEAAGAPAVIELDGLDLFRKLPLHGPRRLLFGARLAETRRPARDRWEVRFAPDSGVLFTDPDLFAGLSLAADADVAEVLKSQAELAADAD